MLFSKSLRDFNINSVWCETFSLFVLRHSSLPSLYDVYSTLLLMCCWTVNKYKQGYQAKYINIDILTSCSFYIFKWTKYLNETLTLTSKLEVLFCSFSNIIPLLDFGVCILLCSTIEKWKAPVFINFFCVKLRI